MDISFLPRPVVVKILMKNVHAPDYKLRRSKLKPSLLLTRRITPSLKNFSSPPGVRPPIYHLSAPITSRKPSLLLSLPRRPDDPGMGMAVLLAGDVDVDGDEVVFRGGRIATLEVVGCC